MPHNPYLSLIRRAWRYAAGQRPKTLLIYGLFVMANLVIMSEPYILGKLLNILQSGGNDLFAQALPYLIAYGSISLFFWAFHGPARVIERITSFQVFTNFLTKVFQTTTSLPMKWHKNNHSGATINKMNKSAFALKEYTDDSYIYIETVVKFIVSLAAILFLLPVFGLFSLVGALLVMLVIFRFDAYLIPLLHKINEGEHRVAAAVYDYISNISTVVTLRLEKLVQKEVLRKVLHIFPIFRKNLVWNEVKWFLISILLALLQFVVIGLYLYQKTRPGEVFLIGNFVMLYEYMGKFMAVFFELASKYETLVKHNTNVEASDSLFAAAAVLTKPKSKVSPPLHWQEIAVEHLSFRYEDERHAVHQLKDITLRLRRGAKIALVGASGGGKSTLMSLIRGLNEAQSGQVHIDGRSYPSLEVLKDMTTLLPQDPEIFENTIEYNITAGITHRKNEILEACHLACFDLVLKKLPSGLKTHINERGVNLSGGEKQRLALARGIFAAKESSIVLLDEPTSSVDTMTERKIYENLFRHFGGKCIVSSIHRLHLLSLFDRIYVLESGKVVEEGNFEELIKSQGELQKMYAKYQEK